MGVAYVIAGYLFFISILVKVIMHIQLDNAHGRRIVVSPVSSWKYLLPYQDDVSEPYQKRRIICNKIQKAAILFFVLMLLLLIIKSIIAV